MAVVAEGSRRRTYLPATKDHLHAAKCDKPDSAPDVSLPANPRDFKTPNYGLTHFADLFTNRQLVALTTFSDLVGEARARAEEDAKEAGHPPESATAYADAIALYLALASDRISDRHTSVSGWDSSPTKEQVRGVFARQAIPMTWDYAEGNPFGTSSGNLLESSLWVSRVIDRLPR